MAKKKREASSEETLNAFDENTKAVALLLRSDPIAFAKYICGVTPHPKQAEFLSLPIEENMHVMLPWGRQEGKSFITAVYIAHRLFAKQGFRAYLFSPSEDQTRQIYNDVIRFFKTTPLRQLVSCDVNGDTIKIGDERWGAFCELVKIGFEGRLGRGRSTRGNGVIVFDELGVMQQADIAKGNLTPITASGGGEIILSSPSDPGSTLHHIYEFWKQAQDASNPRYRVIECDWSETGHLTQQWVDDQRAEYEARGALWQFEREILGKWVAPADVWFPYDDLQRCIVARPDYNPKDQFVWACDWGGRGRSAAVVAIARYCPRLQRLEVVDLLQFYLDNDNRYYRDTKGADIISGENKWGQIEDILLDLRDRYPPSWVGVDPATENSLSGRLENVYRFPIEEILIGGYSQKLKLYTALQAGIRAQKVVWNHSAITDQLRSFCPKRKENGQYEFPSTNTDIVVCMVNLYQYLGQREETPFDCLVGSRPKGGKLW